MRLFMFAAMRMSNLPFRYLNLRAFANVNMPEDVLKGTWEFEIIKRDFFTILLNANFNKDLR